MIRARKPRVENPERCIRTRGIKAAMQALLEHGPSASLDSVASIAGCPKASLSRVFESKEALLLAALSALDALTIQQLREAATNAGGGRAGALAAASLFASMGPESHACPFNAVSANLTEFTWAREAARKHRAGVVLFYAQTLEPDMGPEEAARRAIAIVLVSDGISLQAATGFDEGCAGVALSALRSVIELP